MANIPAGKYIARATSSDIGASSGGNAQITVAFEINEDGPFKGRSIWGFFSLSDAAAEYTVEKLRNCGWKGNDIREFVGNDDVTSILPDNVQLSISEEPWVGKLRNKIDFVNKLGGGPAVARDRLDGNGLAALQARLASTIAGQPAQKSSGSSPIATGKPRGPAKRRTQEDIDPDPFNDGPDDFENL